MNTKDTGIAITFEKGVSLAYIEQYAKEIRRAAVAIDFLLKEGAYVTEEDERYKELYAWWVNKFNRRPLCKYHIDARSVKRIRPYWSEFDKEVYRTAFQVAVFAGYAVEVSRPEGENYSAKYYALRSLNENKSQPLQYTEDV